ncbi:hypothetical protein B296_00022862 [Ensete ventricosum]|uniref:Uncharacterized protein n=1 Tax=Ensete ventricosum TaxID=4639 RepID=A0A426Z3F1_ENSVE|nr:hypothetical protein B296_00022862 [Ensete ventricosum]
MVTTVGVGEIASLATRLEKRLERRSCDMGPPFSAKILVVVPQRGTGSQPGEVFCVRKLVSVDNRDASGLTSDQFIHRGPQEPKQIGHYALAEVWDAGLPARSLLCASFPFFALFSSGEVRRVMVAKEKMRRGLRAALEDEKQGRLALFVVFFFMRPSSKTTDKMVWLWRR